MSGALQDHVKVGDNLIDAVSKQVAELHGHSQEVCGLKWCPQATQLASGGNDNILNIWEARRNQVRTLLST